MDDTVVTAEMYYKERLRLKTEENPGCDPYNNFGRQLAILFLKIRANTLYGKFVMTKKTEEQTICVWFQIGVAEVAKFWVAEDQLSEAVEFLLSVYGPLLDQQCYRISLLRRDDLVTPQSIPRG